MHTKGKVKVTVREMPDGSYGIYSGNVLILTSSYEGTAYYVASLIDASYGMTTDEAVRYLEHGPEILKALDALVASPVVSGIGASIRDESRRANNLPKITAPGKPDIEVTQLSDPYKFACNVLAKLESNTDGGDKAEAAWHGLTGQ
jgi:hypothetical protein